MNHPPAAARRALGVDFGERRIGLALSDVDGRFALPLETVARTTDRRAIYHIAALARREGVGLLVVGDPHHVDGSPSDNRERVHRFGAKLSKVADLPVRWVDEALTSNEAQERLRRVGMADTHRPERLDMVAAQVLLQEALDGGGVETAPGQSPTSSEAET